jgi:hypothetical protein
MKNHVHQLTSSLCKTYEVKPSGDIIIITTPLRYDDGDHVVVFVTPQQDETFCIDDNGEAATRLMFEGIDLESQHTQTLITRLCAVNQIQWQMEKGALWCKAPLKTLTQQIIQVAQASVQMQTLVSVPEPNISHFKQLIIEVIEQVQQETGCQVQFDVRLDNQPVYADAYFMTKTPLAVIAASSVERLLEAQLLWATVKKSVYVLAVVESVAQVGQKRFSQANYYTDKTVEYEGMAATFRNLLVEQIKS